LLVSVVSQKGGIEQAAAKLAAVVSKPESEILLLLNKVIYTNKRKELK
jgi:hypothetical protein